MGVHAALRGLFPDFGHLLPQWRGWGHHCHAGGASIGVPSLTYGLDGEGRPYSATESAHNLVTATAYNAASGPTLVTVGNAAGGSSDTDSFAYDPNTYRPTALTNNINPTASPYSVAANLTWNANGSLQKFQYTDGSPGPLSQTCNYQADDLSRIASANCGGAWAQTFTYDRFGNISKSGSSSYGATYSAAANQANVFVTASYDSTGNQKTSGPGTLTWNALSEPITVNSTSVTYDALGRMVEKGAGSTYTQFVYRPSGDMLAEYSGGLVKGTAPLPGGATAIYNSGGLSYIRHTDWLGSSRLATTWAHAVYAKEAYAPYGETYNEAGTADRSYTGQDQDVLSAGGVYDFLYRKHDPSAGRWMSPDPAGWGAVDLSNPQSLDRYAYVTNMPLSLVHPDGLKPITACTPQYTSKYIPGGTNPQGGEPYPSCWVLVADPPLCFVIDDLTGQPYNPFQFPNFGWGGSGSGGLRIIAKAICGALPSGTMASISGNGNFVGTSGSLDLITNLRTGEVTGFFSPGYFAGAATAMVSMTGGFTFVAGSVSTSSGGPAGPFSGISPSTS